MAEVSYIPCPNCTKDISLTVVAQLKEPPKSQNASFEITYHNKDGSVTMDKPPCHVIKSEKVTNTTSPKASENGVTYIITDSFGRELFYGGIDVQGSNVTTSIEQLKLNKDTALAQKDYKLACEITKQIKLLEDK